MTNPNTVYVAVKADRFFRSLQQQKVKNLLKQTVKKTKGVARIVGIVEALEQRLVTFTALLEKILYTPLSSKPIHPSSYLHILLRSFENTVFSIIKP